MKLVRTPCLPPAINQLQYNFQRIESLASLQSMVSVSDLIYDRSWFDSSHTLLHSEDAPSTGSLPLRYPNTGLFRHSLREGGFIYLPPIRWLYRHYYIDNLRTCFQVLSLRLPETAVTTPCVIRYCYTSNSYSVKYSHKHGQCLRVEVIRKLIWRGWRGLNPWAPAWQASILTNWTTSPNREENNTLRWLQMQYLLVYFL